jgi:hypothetical protein
VVEIGSGVGREGTLAIDSNLALLRERLRLGHGPAICADAADPPLSAASVPTLLLENVLDSCDDPFTVLAQADALLAPGGRLVLACAFAFDRAVTDPARWFTEEQLLAALRGEIPFGPYALGLRPAEVHDDLQWRLRVRPRTEHVHRVTGIVADKRA